MLPQNRRCCKKYYSSLILSSASSSRALWNSINRILHRTPNRSLPTSSSLYALPQLFATYFSDKTSLFEAFATLKRPHKSVKFLLKAGAGYRQIGTAVQLTAIDSVVDRRSDRRCRVIVRAGCSILQSTVERLTAMADELDDDGGSIVDGLVWFFCEEIESLPTLQRLIRTSIRRQLSSATGGRTILGAIEELELSEQLSSSSEIGRLL